MVYVVRSQERRDSVENLVGNADVFVCDVEHQEQIDHLAAELSERYDTLHGLVHSIAFGDYSEGPKPFHETSKEQMLRGVRHLLFFADGNSRSAEKVTC